MTRKTRSRDIRARTDISARHSGVRELYVAVGDSISLTGVGEVKSRGFAFQAIRRACKTRSIAFAHGK